MPEYDCINQRIMKMEDKLESHKDTLEQHNRRLTDLANSLHENTKLTQQIADNTSELVDLFKGAKMFRKFALWASPLVVAIMAAWHYFTGK